MVSRFTSPIRLRLNIHLDVGVLRPLPDIIPKPVSELSCFPNKRLFRVNLPLITFSNKLFSGHVILLHLGPESVDLSISIKKDGEGPRKNANRGYLLPNEISAMDRDKDINPTGFH